MDDFLKGFIKESGVVFLGEFLKKIQINLFRHFCGKFWKIFWISFGRIVEQAESLNESENSRDLSGTILATPIVICFVHNADQNQKITKEISL